MSNFIYKNLTELKEEVSQDLTDKQKALFAILTRNTQMIYYVSECNQVFEQERLERELLQNKELAIFTIDNLGV